MTTNNYLDQHCACKRSLRTETKLSFLAFRVKRQFSGERAHLPGIKLLFPSVSKIPAWLFSSPYWPRRRLSQYAVGSKNNRRYIFSASGNKVYLADHDLDRMVFITVRYVNIYFIPSTSCLWVSIPSPLRWVRQLCYILACMAAGALSIAVAILLVT